ncbi:DUF2892 domain-containing protein [Pontibacter beigongshangensis]|uniref:DUF2892 domain-containing protein n=1 Tax=Pontibacter beigongshangensis TaxID=2574733 RepID=UPI00164EE606|nr:DUF2892 domain-containing protein [Pontibacter beigongshangensis]
MKRTAENTKGRVRESSTKEANQKIDEALLHSLKAYLSANKTDLTERIKALEKEWDIERVLEVNASTLALSGVLLGAFVNRRWFILPGVVTTFLLQHGVQGWCPPLPVLRALGIRSRREIEEEKYALKLLRGDFSPVPIPVTAEQLLELVRK